MSPELRQPDRHGYHRHQHEGTERSAPSHPRKAGERHGDDRREGRATTCGQGISAGECGYLFGKVPLEQAGQQHIGDCDAHADDAGPEE